MSGANDEPERLRAELERLHSWAGLLELLDEHWPEDIFPTEPDSETRDPGPRIVSLLRWVERLRAERDAGQECITSLQSVLDELTAAAAEVASTWASDQAERDTLKAAVAEAADCWPDLNALRRLRTALDAPEAPGGES